MLSKISREQLRRYMERYPKSTRVRLISMNDPYTNLKPGDTGTVDSVDGLGTIHISWDKGSTLGVAYGEDLCEIIED